MAAPGKPLNLIVACSRNRVIGRRGRLPWSIPEDQAWLREKTAGAIVILGRRSYETWSQAHTEGRRPIVITSRPGEPLKRPSSCDPREKPLVAESVPAALALAETLPGDLFICGGERIFRETLPLAHRLYLTQVDADIDGDAFFPDWGVLSWNELYARRSSPGALPLVFRILERRA